MRARDHIFNLILALLFIGLGVAFSEARWELRMRQHCLSDQRLGEVLARLSREAQAAREGGWVADLTDEEAVRLASNLLLGHLQNLDRGGKWESSGCVMGDLAERHPEMVEPTTKKGK